MSNLVVNTQQELSSHLQAARANGCRSVTVRIPIKRYTKSEWKFDFLGITMSSQKYETDYVEAKYEF